MRTFILRARKGTTRWQQIRSHVGMKNHIEIIAHSVMNAFFISNDFRQDVEFYIVLESSEDFPKTIRLVAEEGLSLSGFHEEAVIELLENTLKCSEGLKKDETKLIAPGVWINGFGFEKLVKTLLATREVYLLDRKGKDIRELTFSPHPVFVLSDHLPMPKNNVKSFIRQGMKTMSLGKKMLFASQCIVLLNDELDRG